MATAELKPQRSRSLQIFKECTVMFVDLLLIWYTHLAQVGWWWHLSKFNNNSKKKRKKHGEIIHCLHQKRKVHGYEVWFYAFRSKHVLHFTGVFFFLLFKLWPLKTAWRLTCRKSLRGWKKFWDAKVVLSQWQPWANCEVNKFYYQKNPIFWVGFIPIST